MIRGCCPSVYDRVNTACGLKRTFKTSALDVWTCDFRFKARLATVLDHAGSCVDCPRLPRAAFLAAYAAPCPCGGLCAFLVACGALMSGRRKPRLASAGRGVMEWWVYLLALFFSACHISSSLNAVWTRNQFPSESSTIKSAMPFLLMIFVIVFILSFFCVRVLRLATGGSMARSG